MAYITEENNAGSASANKASGFLTWLSNGFISMMERMYENAKHRLPPIHKNEEAGIEAELKKRSAYQGLEDDTDHDLSEQQNFRGYLSAEKFHYYY